MKMRPDHKASFFNHLNKKKAPLKKMSSLTTFYCSERYFVRSSIA